MTQWPVVELDSVQRLRILAAGLPYVFYDEAVLDAPLERVWDLVGDLEGGVPRFELGVGAVELTRGEDGALRASVRTRFGMQLSYAVELTPGWCVMQSPRSQIGMAAIAIDEGRRTRFAHFEGSRLLGRMAKPLFRWNIRGDFRRIREILRARS